MAKKSEGQAVREAFDGPKVEHDQLIDQIEARAREQHARASDASESAAKVSAFIEQTALNTQAYSWMSSIIKKLPKKDGQAKAMDIIRSLEVGLPMIKAHVGGQGTGEMDLEGPDDEADEADDSDDDDIDTDQDATFEDGDPELADEAAEFESQANQVVTPINFGSRA